MLVKKSKQYMQKNHMLVDNIVFLIWEQSLWKDSRF